MREKNLDAASRNDFLVRLRRVRQAAAKSFEGEGFASCLCSSHDLRRTRLTDRRCAVLLRSGAPLKKKGDRHLCISFTVRTHTKKYIVLQSGTREALWLQRAWTEEFEETGLERRDRAGD